MVKFNPRDDKEVLIAFSNKTMLHYNLFKESADDTDSNGNSSVATLVQEYTHHLASVFCMEFLDRAKKEEEINGIPVSHFTGTTDNDNDTTEQSLDTMTQNTGYKPEEPLYFVSSSEDKTLQIWNLKINMPIKQIADPAQHSMSFLVKHPTKNYFVAQSTDNTILSFSSLKAEKFKKVRKKTFLGHNCAGYGIELCFTPDGKNLISGDSFGYINCWDWTKCRLVKRLKIDDKVISSVSCHPLETSLVCAAGLSGKIYLYS
ncbi:unnamed protein product [Ambrosiozyma monospora]|uniref:Unnamed protein product n=1 Tax=Ambrosiozyma monospora TaxID=43982 RepID=A0ACB5U7B3_AMBMO|nr:unnamed protein product [Ambrosiozyma monospora]